MKLKINGKEYGLQWGMGAVEIYCDAMGCDLDGLDKPLMGPSTLERQRAITHLTVAAIQNWCELNDAEFDLTYKKFQVWLDEAAQETADQILADWKKSMFLGRTIGQVYFGESSETATPQKKRIKSASVNS